MIVFQIKRGEDILFRNESTGKWDRDKFEEEMLITGVSLLYYLLPVRWIKRKLLGCSRAEEETPNTMTYSEARLKIFSTVSDTPSELIFTGVRSIEPGDEHPSN